MSANRFNNRPVSIYRFPPLSRYCPAASQSPQAKDCQPEIDQQQFDPQHAIQDYKQGFAQGLAEGTAEGYRDGSSQGFSEGMHKGLEQARQRFLHAAEPLAGAVDQVQQFLADYPRRRREELLQLVEKVTRQVIRCELALQPTQVLALVEEVLKSLPNQPEQIQVLLNPEEFGRILELEPEKAKQWRLAADETLAPGECRVITAITEIDVGCQHRLDHCMTLLEKNLREPTSE